MSLALSDCGESLEEIVHAARRAKAQGVPLDLLQDEPLSDLSHDEKARRLQELDRAVQMARDAVPGLEVRLHQAESGSRTATAAHPEGLRPSSS